MPYVGQDWTPPRDPTEGVKFTLDFAPWLASGETISTAVWSCAVVSGTDANPGTHINGSALINGTQTQQLVSTLLPGVKYRLTALVTTSAGQTLSLWSHITCQAPS